MNNLQFESHKKRVKIEPLPFIDAIEAMKKRKVVLPEEYYGEKMVSTRALAFTVSGLAGISQIKSVLDSINRAIEKGDGFDTWQDKVKDGAISTALPQHRQELVYRNAVQNAYSIGRHTHYQKHKETRPYLRYSAVNDSRPRPSHGAMHGPVLPVDDPFWATNTPPNGHACRCTVMSLSKRQAGRTGISGKAPGVNPDEGWGYNPGTDYAGEMENMLKEKVAGLRERSRRA
ncbi:MAG: minor capsid protein [Opitutae bacterium]|nr:minor capsid protein [Opitutae bacterium]